MNCEISEALKRLAAEYGRATTQKERDRLTREIARVSYSQEADRAKSRRNSRQGAFDARSTIQARLPRSLMAARARNLSATAELKFPPM